MLWPSKSFFWEMHGSHNGNIRVIEVDHAAGILAVPNAPTLVSPANNATNVLTSSPLAVTVSDPDGGPLTVTFYGRRSLKEEADFTIIGLPDTQYYTGERFGGLNAFFKAQTAWIVDQLTARNIVMVSHFGDCADQGDNNGNPIEWQRADTAMSVLEDPAITGLSEGIPYHVSVGNHDQTPRGDAAGTTHFYNQYFGANRFAGSSFYAGHYGSLNDNHFLLFEVGELSFILISMEFDDDPDAPVLAWADSLLAAHPERVGIFVSHEILEVGSSGPFQPNGQIFYDTFKDNPNLDLMLCGHNHGESWRTDTYNGHVTQTIMANYQRRTNGGDGWMRIMEFSPSKDELRVSTYSPVLDQFERDADSEFALPFPLDLPWQQIGNPVTVASGATASVNWPDRDLETGYEWYASVSDGSNTVSGPIWNFTTTSTAAMSVTTQGQGSVTKNPNQSTYQIGSTVALQANPAAGWAFSSWGGDASGTSNPLDLLVDGPKQIIAQFTDAQAPTAEVVFPLQTTTLTVGETASLQWSASDNVGVTQVNLLLSRNGAEGDYEVLANGLANTGTYSWVVEGPATNDAFLKVEVSDAAGNKSNASSAAASNLVFPTATLTVDIIGDGAVTKVPDQPEYILGTTVALSVTPTSGWAFTGWEGDASGEANPLTVQIDKAKQVTAQFADAAAPEIIVVFPTENATLPIDETVDLQWTAVDNVSVTKIDLLLSRTGAEGSYETIASDLSNTGSLPWVVTGPASDVVFLKAVAYDSTGNKSEGLSEGVSRIIEIPEKLGLRAFQMEGEIAGIQADLPLATKAAIAIFDLRGSLIELLAEGFYPAGTLELQWNPSNLSGGVYLVKMEVPEQVLVHKFIMVR